MHRCLLVIKMFWPVRFENWATECFNNKNNTTVSIQLSTAGNGRLLTAFLVPAFIFAKRKTTFILTEFTFTLALDNYLRQWKHKQGLWTRDWILYCLPSFISVTFHIPFPHSLHKNPMQLGLFSLKHENFCLKILKKQPKRNLANIYVF